MDRPRSANWIIPLILAYSIVSAGFAALTVVGLAFDPIRSEPNVLANGVLMLAMWSAVFVGGVGFVSAKRWAAMFVGVPSAMLIAASPLGILALLFGRTELLGIATATTKATGMYYLVDFFIPISSELVRGILFVGSPIDAVVLALFLWFCARRQTRAWIAAAHKVE